MTQPVQSLNPSISFDAQPDPYMRMRIDDGVMIKGLTGQATVKAHNIAWREDLCWQVYAVTENEDVSQHQLLCSTSIPFTEDRGILLKSFDRTATMKLDNVKLRMTKIKDKAAIKEQLEQGHAALKLPMTSTQASSDPHKFKIAARIVDSDGLVVCKPAFSDLIYNSEKYGAHIDEVWSPEYGNPDGGMAVFAVTGSSLAMSKEKTLKARFDTGYEVEIPAKDRRGTKKATVRVVYPSIHLRGEMTHTVKVQLLTEDGPAGESIDFTYREQRPSGILPAACTAVEDHASYDLIRQGDALPTEQAYPSMVIQLETPTDCVDDTEVWQVSEEPEGEDELFTAPQHFSSDAEVVHGQNVHGEVHGEEMEVNDVRDMADKPQLPHGIHSSGVTFGAPQPSHTHAEPLVVEMVNGSFPNWNENMQSAALGEVEDSTSNEREFIPAAANAPQPHPAPVEPLPTSDLTSRDIMSDWYDDMEFDVNGNVIGSVQTNDAIASEGDKVVRYDGPPIAVCASRDEVSTGGPPASSTGGPAATYTGGPAATYTGGPAATYTGGPAATYTGGPAATYTGGPAATYTGGPAATYTGGPPATYTGGPAATYTGGPPATYTGEPPATYTGGPAATYTGGPAATYTGGPAATYTGGPPATYTGGPPATYTGGPPATYTGGPAATYTGGPAATFTGGTPATESYLLPVLPSINDKLVKRSLSVQSAMMPPNFPAPWAVVVSRASSPSPIKPPKLTPLMCGGQPAPSTALLSPNSGHYAQRDLAKTHKAPGRAEKRGTDQGRGPDESPPRKVVRERPFERAKTSVMAGIGASRAPNSSVRALDQPSQASESDPRFDIENNRVLSDPELRDLLLEMFPGDSVLTFEEQFVTTDQLPADLMQSFDDSSPADLDLK